MSNYYGQAGVAGLINEDDVIQYIKFLMREANNPRNDGWVQKAYGENLRRIRDELNTVYHSSQYSPYSGMWYPSSSTTTTTSGGYGLPAVKPKATTTQTTNTQPKKDTGTSGSD